MVYVIACIIFMHKLVHAETKKIQAKVQKMIQAKNTIKIQAKNEKDQVKTTHRSWGSRYG